MNDYRDKVYAFVVENEVFNIFSASGATKELAESYYVGFLNDHKSLNLKNYPLAMRGYLWNGKTFIEDITDYKTSDGKSIPTPEAKYIDQLKFSSFGFVSNNRLFFIINLPNDNEEIDLWRNAFETGVQVVDISNYNNIERGDLWNGNSFIKPDNSQIHKNGTSSWQKWKNNLGDSRPWHILMPGVKLVSLEVSTKRFDICSSCPELIKATSTCKKCGCFMKVKTRIEAASCPLAKW